MTELQLPTAIMPRKTPLAEAALILAELCDLIDGGAEIGPALMGAFNDTRLQLADAVDRRICFDTWIKGAQNAARRARDEWATRAKQLDALHDAFKENTKAVLLQAPDLPYQGKLGKIALQKNPPALRLAFGDKYVTLETIEMFGIPDRFLRVETIRSVDIGAVKEAIQGGDQVPWAEIEQGQHVRFRK